MTPISSKFVLASLSTQHHLISDAQREKMAKVKEEPRYLADPNLWWSSQEDIKSIKGELPLDNDTKPKHDPNHQTVSRCVKSRELTMKETDGSPATTKKKRKKPRKPEVDPRERAFVEELYGNLCRYQCHWCFDFECGSYRLLLAHIHKRHPSLHYMHHVAGDVETYATKLVRHTCKICGKQILHDLYHIATHVRLHKDVLTGGRHDKLWEYVALTETISEKGRQIRRICKVYLKRSPFVESVKAKELKNIVPALPGILSRSKNGVDKNRLRDEQTTYEIAELCLFRCPKCRFQTEGLQTFYIHLKRCLKQKAALGSENVVEARYHRCKVCDAKILCTLPSIKAHVTAVHKVLNFEKYRWMAPKRGEKGPRQSAKGSVTELPKHLAINLTITTEQYASIPDESITFAAENLCEFECDNCFSFTSITWGAMKAHIRGCKKQSAFSPAYVISARIHQCKLCSSRLLCDIYPIKRHIQFKHSLSLEAYRALSPPANLGSQLSESPTKNEAPSKHLGAWTIAPSDVPVVEPLEKVRNPPNALPEHLTTTKVGHFCVWACRECPFQSKSLDGMMKHNAKTGHGPRTCREGIVSCLKVARYHRCKVCSKVIACDKGVITNHAMGGHDLSLPQYLEIKSEEEGLETRQQPNSSTKPETRVFRGRNLLPHAFSYTLKGVLKPEDMTREMGNHCVFRCSKCEFRGGSWLAMCHHYRAEHDQVLMQFRADCVEEARYHECWLCGCAVLCDEELVRRHLQTEHRTTKFQDYRTKCGEREDESLKESSGRSSE